MAKAMKFGSGKAKRYNEGGALEVPEKGTGLQKETFKEAFRRARDRKAPDFEWNGKKYTTEYKEEKAAREAKEKAQKSAKKVKESDVTAVSMTDEEIADIKAKQARAGKESQNDRVPFMKRRIKPEYTKEVNDALTMGLQGGVLAKEVPKALGYLRGAPKDVAKRIEPTYKKGGGVKKMASGGSVKSASSRADGCAVRGKTRA
jgi:flagellar biosynthesis GTPase FlhF